MARVTPRSRKTLVCESATKASRLRRAKVGAILFLVFGYQGGASGGLAFSKSNFALVVGVSDYEVVRPNARARNEAAAIGEALVRRARFAPENVTVIGTESRRATRSAILRGADHVCHEASNSSLLLLFFSGRTALANDEFFLLPSDVEIGDKVDILRETGISLRSLSLLLRDCQPEAVLVLLSGRMVGDFASAQALREALARGWGDRAEQPGKFFGLVSDVRQGEANPDEGVDRLGPLARAFVEGISGAAVDESGRVTVRALSKYLRGAVAKAATVRGEEAVFFVADKGSDVVILRDGKQPNFTQKSVEQYRLRASIEPIVQDLGPISKSFHVTDEGIRCNDFQDRSTSFCFNEAERITGWFKPQFSVTRCQDSSSAIRKIKIDPSNPKCLVVDYILKGCPSSSKECAERSWLVFDVTVIGEKYSEPRSERREWPLVAFAESDLQQVYRYGDLPAGSRVKRWSYEVEVVKQLQTGIFAVHLTDRNPEAQGIRTLITDDGLLNIDVSEAARHWTTVSR